MMLSGNAINIKNLMDPLLFKYIKSILDTFKLRENPGSHHVKIKVESDAILMMLKQDWNSISEFDKVCDGVNIGIYFCAFLFFIHGFIQ